MNFRLPSLLVVHKHLWFAEYYYPNGSRNNGLQNNLNATVFHCCTSISDLAYFSVISVEKVIKTKETYIVLTNVDLLNILPFASPIVFV